MPTLQYTGGGSPFEDIKAFEAKVRKQFPGISDYGVQRAIKRAVARKDPLVKGRFVALFGRDIMTDAIEGIPAWSHLPQSMQRRILAHPTSTGERVTEGEDAKITQLELAGRLDHHSVNRSALISPRGLEQTYVWCMATNWLQEVTPNDYDLIIRQFDLRRLFRDPDRHGLYQDVRSYNEGIVTDTYMARDASDVRQLVRQHSRQQQFGGVDLAGKE